MNELKPNKRGGLRVGAGRKLGYRKPNKIKKEKKNIEVSLTAYNYLKHNKKDKTFISFLDEVIKFYIDLNKDK